MRQLRKTQRFFLSNSTFRRKTKKKKGNVEHKFESNLGGGGRKFLRQQLIFISSLLFFLSKTRPLKEFSSFKSINYKCLCSSLKFNFMRMCVAVSLLVLFDSKIYGFLNGYKTIYESLLFNSTNRCHPPTSSPFSFVIYFKLLLRAKEEVLRVRDINIII